MDQRVLRDRENTGTELEVTQKTFHSWWKHGLTYPSQKIGDCVRYISREHNPEAGHKSSGKDEMRRISDREGMSAQHKRSNDKKL